MKDSTIKWALRAVSPWCLGTGLLVSFTANASYDPFIGASLAPMSPLAEHAAVTPMQEDKLASTSINASEMTWTLRNAARQEARLMVGGQQDLSSMPDESAPRIALKRNAGLFPTVERVRKGDPVLGLRPTFDTKWRMPGSLETTRMEQIMFHEDSSNLVSVFKRHDNAPYAPADAKGGAPTVAAANLASPLKMASLNANSAPLASSSPVDLANVPTDLTAAPSANETQVSKTEAGQPNYAALINPARLESEKHCLAQAIYFEARSEPAEGQAAVAQVILNRVKSGLYPTSVCGVVFQNRSHYKACQFSFACEGKALRIHEQQHWTQAQQIADDVLDGRMWLADVGSSTHYHANYVRPRWARQLKKMDVIGKHIFYQLKPGQT